MKLAVLALLASDQATSAHLSQNPTSYSAWAGASLNQTLREAEVQAESTALILEYQLAAAIESGRRGFDFLNEKTITDICVNNVLSHAGIFGAAVAFEPYCFTSCADPTGPAFGTCSSNASCDASLMPSAHGTTPALGRFCPYAYRNFSTGGETFEVATFNLGCSADVLPECTYSSPDCSSSPDCDSSRYDFTDPSFPAAEWFWLPRGEYLSGALRGGQGVWSAECKSWGPRLFVLTRPPDLTPVPLTHSIAAPAQTTTRRERPFSEPSACRSELGPRRLVAPPTPMSTRVPASGAWPPWMC